MAMSAARAAAQEPGTPVAVAPGVPGHGRAWELVTPADPVPPTFVNAERGVSVAGDRIAILTLGPLAGFSSGVAIGNVLAERGVDGWTVTPLEFPLFDALGQLDLLFTGPQAFSPDLSASIWTGRLPLQPGESAKEIGLFRRDPLGRYTLLAQIGREGHFVAASEDLQRVVFLTDAHLLPEDASRSEGRSVYELVGSEMRLVDVADDGSLLSSCGSEVPEMPGAVSSDGRRIFLVSVGPSAPCTDPPRIYLREAGDTTEISASHCARSDCNAAQGATFAGATPDGSVAFFTTAQQLTSDDVDSVTDLYRYDVASGALSRISSRPLGLPGGGVVAQSALSSSDGSRVYFKHDGRLLPGLGDEERRNLYVADAGGLRYVATEVGAEPQISADGRYAVFSTPNPLTAGDTDEYPDLYRYDAVDGSYVWLSHGAGGEGNGAFFSSLSGISEDGGVVSFRTDERLLPEDHNEGADLYEWAGGTLGLLSAGAGDLPPEYLFTTPDGRTVFFTTNATLLPRDRDGGDLDIYAARVGGGFPEVASPPSCEGDACRRGSSGRVERSAPRVGSDRGRIELARIGPEGRRRIVSTGTISLLLEVPSAGHLSASARARIGSRLRTVAFASADVKRAGPVRLRMPLSPPARRTLARGGSLRLRLLLRLSGLDATRALSFSLGKAR